MGKPSSSRREPTQMLDAQRVKRSMETHARTTPPASRKTDTSPITVSPHNIHDKPTIPIDLQKRMGLSGKNASSSNPFEKESSSGRVASPSTHQLFSEHRPIDPDLLLQESSPLLMHRDPLDTASSWTVSSFASSPEHLLVAWLQGSTLNLRDEYGKHHMIDLSRRLVTAIHHDPSLTWFGTAKGRLFCFDRKNTRLTLAHEVLHHEPIAAIFSLPDQDLLCVATQTGKLYKAPRSSPDQIERHGPTLPQGIRTGTWSPLHEELFLLTGDRTIQRASLHTGVPPGGAPIALDFEATAIFAHPTQPLLYVHAAAELHLLKLETRQSKRICTARLPSSSCHTYLAHDKPHARLLYTRGNVLFHANVL